MNDTDNSIEELLLSLDPVDSGMTDRQRQILNAAIKIFSEKGYDGTRTSDIAKEAHIAEGTIFRYYKTKKDLLLGLITPITINLIRPLVFQSLQKILEDDSEKDIREIFEEIFMDRLKLFKKNLPLIKTVAMESMYHPELRQAFKNGFVAKFIPSVDKFIEKNIKAGKIRDVDPRLITRTFVSLFLGYLLATNISPEFFPVSSDEEEMKKIVDIFLNGVSAVSTSDSHPSK